jgi:hypothetical protein
MIPHQLAHFDVTQRGKSCQKREALHTSLPVGRAEGVNAFREVVAGSGD